jgi:small-conductance mechanosensitive channel
LIEAARSVKEVLSEPPPRVHFTSFGDSAINLQIRVWINEPRDHAVIRSHVNFAIERTFRRHNIEIPLPQLDLNLKSDSLKISRDESVGANLESQTGGHAD